MHGSVSTYIVLSRVPSFLRMWKFGDFGSHSGRRIIQMVNHNGDSLSLFSDVSPDTNEKFSLDVTAFRTMLDELCSLIRKKKLTAPVCAEVGLPDYIEALNAALQPFASAKQVLIMWANSPASLWCHRKSQRRQLQPPGRCVAKHVIVVKLCFLPHAL